MRILLQTRFYPDFGGIEVLSELLAKEWASQGIKVTVLSTSPRFTSLEPSFPFEVVHFEGPRAVFRLARSHDVIVSMNVSLKYNLPSLMALKPHVIVHQSCYMSEPGNRRPLLEGCKIFIAKNMCYNIAASRFIADRIGIDCTVIPNPYNATLFTDSPYAENVREVVFVGRLVSDKGVDVLIQAISKVRDKIGRCPTTTIIGEGPERGGLEKRCVELHLSNVSFLGKLKQSDIAVQLRNHKIMVVPSLWEEPFGIVALEGIASGCYVIASNGGGLPEAVGPCGSLFERGDADGLAHELEKALVETRAIPVEKKCAHLDQHAQTVVAYRYLEFFKSHLR